jgi:hypothetical protein
MKTIATLGRPLEEEEELDESAVDDALVRSVDVLTIPGLEVDERPAVVCVRVVAVAVATVVVDRVLVTVAAAADEPADADETRAELDCASEVAEVSLSAAAAEDACLALLLAGPLVGWGDGSSVVCVGCLELCETDGAAVPESTGDGEFPAVLVGPAVEGSGVDVDGPEPSELRGTAALAPSSSF